MSRKNRTAFYALSILLCWVAAIEPGAAPALPGPAAGRVRRGEILEVRVRVEKAYENPYVQGGVMAKFVSPSGRIWEIGGFWDGGQNWGIRFSPDETGEWRYSARSRGHGFVQEGSFVCVPSEHRGVLRINPRYPYSFAYSDGTPFFWMGDTAWGALWDQVTLDDFKRYVDRRAAQHFNTIHMLTYEGRNEGGEPFLNGDRDRLNPAYYQSVDRKLEYLQAKDIGAGLCLTWAQDFLAYAPGQFERYIRYMVARYAAYRNIVWFVSGEFEEEKTSADYAQFGELLSMLDPYRHPVSIHTIDSSNEFAERSWLAYVMQQIREEDGGVPISQLLRDLGRRDVRVVNEVPTVTVAEADRLHACILQDRRYGKPVVNAEFGYEQYDGRTGLRNRVTPDAVRKLAWAIVTAGGYFTYGNEATYYKPWSLPQQELGGAEFMRHLYAFMTGTQFWKLEPHDELLDYGYCLAAPGEEYVIYLAQGREVRLRLDTAEGKFLGRWYDPRTGRFAQTIELWGKKRPLLRPPSADDWVLWIRRSN